jgi:NarL family two-component system sensor histidine kinase LiaS
LHWQLTGTYVLFTLVLALAFEVVLTQSSAVDQSQYVARRPLFARALQLLVAPQLVPQLTQPASSLAALQDWAATFQKESIQYSASPTDLALDTSLLVRVLDRNGQVLASAVDSAQSPRELQHLIAGPQAADVIRAALADDPRPADLVRALPTGQTVVAVPVLATGGQVVGALVDIQKAPMLFGPLDIVLLTVVFALVASLVGTVFGWLAAWGITRRLRRLAQAAHAWSRGEFQVEVHDQSRDELGQLARDLNRMAEQVQTLFATQQELATVEERQRLARDLHDSVKQDVFATALLIGAARAHLLPDQAQAQAYLAEAEGLAGQARQELTALIQELRPVVLAERGLATALQEYARRWSLRRGIGAEVEVAGEQAVPLEVGMALFRVAQEALANVARHSEADRVTIRLDCDAGVASLVVCDNGQGFDSIQAAGRGVGLASMRERVEARQGTLAIVSGAGGTSVQARLPLRSALTAQEVNV